MLHAYRKALLPWGRSRRFHRNPLSTYRTTRHITPKTFSHLNPLSHLFCCTPASKRLDLPAKHSCRRSGRPNAAKRCAARRQESVSCLIFNTSKCSDLLTVLEMGGGDSFAASVWLSASKHQDVKGYRRQRGKAMGCLIFISDRIRIILPPGILKGVCTLSAHHSNITTVAYTATHTQFVIIINFINFLTNFNHTNCTI